MFRLKIYLGDDELEHRTKLTAEQVEDLESANDIEYETEEDAITGARGDYTKWDGGQLVALNTENNEVVPTSEYGGYIYGTDKAWEARADVKNKYDAMTLLSKRMAYLMDSSGKAELEEMQEFANKHGLPFSINQFRNFRATFRASNPYWDSSSASC